MRTHANLPLSGIVVVDASRMLPGAVLARMLVDMGARVIKVEDPAGGDPLRAVPPLAGGMGAGFAAFYRGAESVALDLREPRHAAALRKLIKHSDVFVESFRPGTLKRWDLGRERLRALNPTLVTCSLSSYGASGDWGRRVGHDLNFTAQSGLLALLEVGHAGRPDSGAEPEAAASASANVGFASLEPAELPRIQAADVASGMLACSAIVAALYAREKTGIGADLDQPLACGPLPFLTWALADAAARQASDGPVDPAASPGMPDLHLAGKSPSYGVYRCQDGKRIALAALEPKFWMSLIEALDQPDLAGDGLDTGERGARARARLAHVFASKPRDHWLAMAAERNLPLTPVNDLADARRDPFYGDRVRIEADGRPGSYFPAWHGGKDRAAPILGEHTAAVLASVGFDLVASGRA